ncbi:uncharacterized protein LOC135944376 [Cloeon dipterum]|uniref:uncharacterized protein LOC135936620 n=1 Tax=Cloeon dipterum TaxID=197152 RepID=UPI00322072AE
MSKSDEDMINLDSDSDMSTASTLCCWGCCNAPSSPTAAASKQLCDEDCIKHFQGGTTVGNSLVRAEAALEKLYVSYNDLNTEYKDAQAVLRENSQETDWLENARRRISMRIERLVRMRPKIEQRVKDASKAVVEFEQRLTEFTKPAQDLSSARK